MTTLMPPAMTLTIRPPAPPSTDPDAFCYATVAASGHLAVLHAPAGGAGLFPLTRRTAGGTITRLQLDAGISAWLDEQAQHDRYAPNWAASHVHAALSEHRRSPWDAPDLYGPVILTGYDGRRPLSLSPAQRHLITAARAGAQEWVL